ncbi:hypothetical protein PQX77_017302 [Marasmius sp. AFHP31]|nr:hypothetical protein PQX77_017302 [Marasmius sp. AFHP31]
MSDFFANAQNFSINGGTFSVINGDQHNHYYERTVQASHLSTSHSGLIAQGTSSRAITTTIHINGNQINNQIVEREEKERTEFDDFRNLKRGDICRLRDICQVLTPCKCYAWFFGRECQCTREVIKTVCTAKLMGVEGEFTVVSYRGQDAHRAFEAEFCEVSRSLFSEVAQVYATDKGTIPSMVFWHNLVPLAQVLSNVGKLVQRYLQDLHDQWECSYEEMWIDPTRGVVCRGPKGPPSYIYVVGLKIKDLPPTAELLQEEVLVRFLACQKWREADDAFMTVIFYAWSDNVPDKRVDRPTIFSALTKIPIAVANNIWESREDTLKERTCLENGWTRFRLNGDGWVWLQSNRDAEKAWLWQAWSVFHARGVSLDNDLEDFYLIHPEAWLEGNLDNSPSKCQLRRQQPIFFFLYPPPPHLRDEKTSSLHHWSFLEDGHPRISPESCLDLGLPVELHYRDRGSYYYPYSHSWPTYDYKPLHQYQIARSFDPTTADFARHLGYGHIFQPLNDSDRFEDVQKDQTSPPPNTSADHGGSLNIIDSEYPSDIPDPIRVEDVVSVSDPQETRDEWTKSSYVDVPNKRQKADFEHGGIEARNHPHQVLRHKNNLDRDGQYMDTGLPPMRPLPARSLPSPRMNPPHHVQQDTSVAQLHPMHLNPPDNRVSRRYPSLLTGLSSRGGLSHYDSKPSTASMYDSLFLPTRTMEESLYMPHIKDPNSFDTIPPFNTHRIPESPHSISKPTTSMTDSPYADPSTYSVGNAAYATDAGYSSGWSGDRQPAPPSHCSGLPLVVADHSNPFVYRPSVASTSTFFHPSHSMIHPQIPHFSHGEVLRPLRYRSNLFDGEGSLDPQHIPSEFVMHSQNQPVFSRSWAGSDGTPSYGQREPSSLGYGESEQWGGNSDGEGWF